MVGALQHEATTVLQRLVRLNTVNPPGNERPAQEFLQAFLDSAGFETTLLGEDPVRPNLVARLRGRKPGPTLGLLSHVDTVVADPAGWRHGPWSGELDDGCARAGGRRKAISSSSPSATRRSAAPAPSGSPPSTRTSSG
jgi:acetylornithine deacetylase/succinyl-diaminopimelate desuccinylase-like protein